MLYNFRTWLYNNYLLSFSDSNQSASSVKRSAIDISTVQGVKFEGVNGDILTVKASVIKKILWDYMKTVKPGS